MTIKVRKIISLDPDEIEILEKASKIFKMLSEETKDVEENNNDNTSSEALKISNLILEYMEDYS